MFEGTRDTIKKVVNDSKQVLDPHTPVICYSPPKIVKTHDYMSEAVTSFQKLKSKVEGI